MPLQATSGAASYDAFGGGVPVAPNYIEDVFSCFLYSGTSAAQTITNGIDLSTKGGLVIVKRRSGLGSFGYVDTARGRASVLVSTGAEAATTNSSSTQDLTSFNTNGFSLGTNLNLSANASGSTYASWSFRKQLKFFDVVTYTGNGTYGRTVAHNLGSVPGFIIVKCISAVQPWAIYHRSLGGTKYMNLNTTAAATTDNAYWNNTDPTSTEFTVGGDGDVNGTSKTYVAYLFAHDAGGFGLTGTDNVISCGSYTGNGSSNGPTVNVGYEPQWLLVKRVSGGAANWVVLDNMRGITTSTFSTSAFVWPNLSDQEDLTDGLSLNATGFKIGTSNNYFNTSGNTYIYIAIRRGPMKVPTSGTSVFAPIARTGTNTVASITGLGFAPDAALIRMRQVAGVPNVWYDRLRGPNIYLETSSTNAEAATTSPSVTSYNNAGISFGTDLNEGLVNASGQPYINWLFGRAPSFFDEVCYTGNGATDRTLTHNLTVAPELIIFKARTIGYGWWTAFGFNLAGFTNKYSAMYLESNGGAIAGLNFFNYSGNYLRALPGASNIQIGSNGEINQSGQNFVAYLFATCAGVSKVFSYTGNGSSQTINCGFTGGARWVMIKRTDSTGDWYVWDSARGIVAGNDPHLSLNTTAAEVTTDDSVDTDSTGFVVNQVSATNVNVSSATYIGIAIA